jgi:hypothetical protein
MTTLGELEDAKRKAVDQKWYQVTSLCREAAKVSRDYRDPVRVRRLLARIEKRLAEAERLERTIRVVQGDVIEGRVIQGRVLKEIAPPPVPA